MQERPTCRSDVTTWFGAHVRDSDNGTAHGSCARDSYNKKTDSPEELGQRFLAAVHKHDARAFAALWSKPEQVRRLLSSAPPGAEAHDQKMVEAFVAEVEQFKPRRIAEFRRLLADIIAQRQDPAKLQVSERN